MDNAGKISQVSSRFSRFCSIIWITVPILTLLYWSFFNALDASFFDDLPSLQGQSLSLQSKLMAITVSALPVIAVLSAVSQLKRLFQLYQQQVFFTEQNVYCFRALGVSVVCWWLANLLFTPLISLIFSFNSADQPHEITIEFGVSDLSLLIVGLLLLLLARVMREAVVLSDEQAYTV